MKEIIQNNKDELDKLYILIKKRKDENDEINRCVEEKKKETLKFVKENSELKNYLKIVSEKSDVL